MKKLLKYCFIFAVAFLAFACGEKEDEKTPTPDVPDVPVEPTPEDPTVPVEPTPEDPTVPVEPTPADPVKEMQEAGVKEMDKYLGFYDSSEYSETNWNVILGYYEECVKTINASTTQSEIDLAIKEAKELILKVLTIYDEEDMLLLQKIEEAEATLTALFEKYPQEEFEYANYYIFRVTYEEAVNKVNGSMTVEEIEEILNEALAAMENVPRLLFITYHDIDGVTWEFQSITQMREELLADYNKFNKSEYTFENIPIESFQYINYDEFYLSEGMQEKWEFLVSFFVDNAKTSNNRNAYALLKSSKDYDSYKSNPTYNQENTPYAISYEFKAFLSMKVVREGHATYGTNNYKDEELCAKIWDYLKPIEEYQKGTTYEFPTPNRKYQQFLGWYDNAEFAGEPITGIKPEDAESKDIFAKWTELTSEDLFNIFKDEKAEELKTYVKKNKVQANYSEAKWAELQQELANAMANILAQPTEEAALTAYQEGLDKINAVGETIFTVSYELNGGHWYFNTREELTKQLLADYSQMKSETIPLDNFFERSYGSLTTFFNKYPQWLWLLDYLKDNCLEGKEGNFDISKGLVEAQVRAEMCGFMMGTQAEYAGYKSGDYSDEAKAKDFQKYAVTRDFEYLEETTKLMTPLKEGYKFVGWYKNADFSGDVVTKVTNTITLYAKWEKAE